VLFKFNAPVPFNVAMLCALVVKFTRPAFESTVAFASVAASIKFNVAPLDTPTLNPASAPEPFNVNVPAVTLVAPVKVLAPLDVNVPAPSFVKEPLPSANTPLAITLPAPPKLTPKSAELIPPLNVNTSASLLIRVALASVIAPPKLLLPIMLRNAPSLEIPVPFSVNPSEPTAIPPCNCNAAPVETVVAPAVVPRAVAF
jgi:hypothetical protein